MDLIKQLLNIIKRILKKLIPASSNTTNGRFNTIEDKLKNIDKQMQELESVLKHIKSYGNANELDLFYLMCKANEVKSIHMDTFQTYKDIHKGKEVVVVGSGPTLKYYEPIENAIHIGVNGVYHNKEIPLEYLFMQDFEGEGKGKVFDIEEIKHLKCHKFVGQYIKKVKMPMYASEYVTEYIGAKPYFVHDYFPGRIGYRMPLDIAYFPLVDNWSTIFAAIHFALYTHPKKIYIVGCDCSYLLGQHFDNITSAPMNIDGVLKHWNLIKEHIETFYPDIEVVSINPIGLTGLFQDSYTTNFIEEQKG